MGTLGRQDLTALSSPGPRDMDAGVDTAFVCWDRAHWGAYTTPEVAFLDCLWGCGVQGLTLMGLGLILAWPFHQTGGMGKSPRLSEPPFPTWVSVGRAAGAGLELSSQGPEQAQGQVTAIGAVGPRGAQSSRRTGHSCVSNKPLRPLWVVRMKG